MEVHVVLVPTTLTPMANGVGPVLPRELFDSILDELGRSFIDRKSLQSCALVCTSFRLCAHRLLFRHIVLASGPEHDLNGPVSIPKEISHIQELYHLLEADTYLTSCIRSLVINIDRRADLEGATPQSLGLLPDVLDILYESTSQARGIVQLSLSGYSTSDHNTSWHSISTPAQQSLLQLICGPKTILKKLALRNLTELPLEIFARYPPFEALSFNRVTIDGPRAVLTQAAGSALDLSLPQHLPQAQSLRELDWKNGTQSLNKFFQDLSTLLPIKALTCNLQHLSYVSRSGFLSVEDRQRLRQIVQWSAGSLKTLKM